MSDDDAIFAPRVAARFDGSRNDFEGHATIDVTNAGLGLRLGAQEYEVPFTAFRSVTGAGRRGMLRIKDETITVKCDPQATSGILELVLEPGPTLKGGAAVGGLVMFATECILADGATTPERRAVVQAAADGTVSDSHESGKEFWFTYRLDAR